MEPNKLKTAQSLGECSACEAKAARGLSRLPCFLSSGGPYHPSHHRPALPAIWSNKDKFHNGASTNIDAHSRTKANIKGTLSRLLSHPWLSALVQYGATDASFATIHIVHSFWTSILILLHFKGTLSRLPYFLSSHGSALV